ncbi:MAG: hypothetical protein ACTSQY_06500 [Candidatus Odinarchaeia archaeon]
MVKKVFRFEGAIELNEGDEILISEWREVKGNLPFEALLVVNKATNKEYKSRTENIKMLKPINKKEINGKVTAIKEKLNIKENQPIILFEVEY